jgi:hypothetical protein
VKNRKNRKIIAAPAETPAADLDVAADVVAAIGPPPDATPAVPAPLRCSVGTAAHVDTLNVPAVLSYLGRPFNGIGTPLRRDSAFVVSAESVVLTPDDAPLLYARAAALLASAASASVNAPNRIGASPLDRMQFLARAAERLIYTADRARSGTRPVRAFNGGYNGTHATRIRIHSMQSIADLPLASDVPAADVCDPLIVAHLAERKTATRPDGGYFSGNVGTIDRPL